MGKKKNTSYTQHKDVLVGSHVKIKRLSFIGWDQDVKIPPIPDCNEFITKRFFFFHHQNLKLYVYSIFFLFFFKFPFKFLNLWRFHKTPNHYFC